MDLLKRCMINFQEECVNFLMHYQYSQIFLNNLYKKFIKSLRVALMASLIVRKQQLS